VGVDFMLAEAFRFLGCAARTKFGGSLLQFGGLDISVRSFSSIAFFFAAHTYISLVAVF